MSTTPAACVKEVRDYAAKKRAEVAPLPPPPPGATVEQQTASLQAANASPAGQQRTATLRQIEADRLSMAKACAAKFDPKTAPEETLTDLATLYTDAVMPDFAKATVERALTVKTLSESARASLLVQAVQAVLREPISGERNLRLEAHIKTLDGLSDAVTDQKFMAHQAANGYYRYDDIDDGIVRHSTWLIEAAKTCSPELRKKHASSAVGAHVNMAQVWAGQGRNDEAIALMRRAITDFADIPNVTSRVTPEIERLQLVGSIGAPLTAPRWLNLPAGQTTLDLKGTVTLLEFTAHWCIPCKESYPGVNRLRAKYRPRGFQAVMVTQLWGYFQAERPLDADTEFARDRTYFAGHGLDVPVAVGDGSKAGKRDPNDLNYKVGGIPQIHLIDKQGRIRLVMVGYDDANEAKLEKMIEGLLKEG